MKKKILMLLGLVMVAMTASADDVPTYSLTKGTSEHGTIAFTNAAGKTITSAAEGQTVTVTITPETGWAVDEPTGQWYAAQSATRSIDLLSKVTLEPVEGEENQWTFIMQRANAEISATYTKVVQSSWIQSIGKLTYTGEELTPTVTVMDGSTTLVEGTDFEVSYSDNVNAGTATVTITGIGKYSGTTTTTFTIDKAEGKVVYNPWLFTKKLGDEDFVILPKVTGNGTLIFWSEDETIAAVDENTGVVTIKSVGVVKIWAKLAESENYTGGSKDWYELTIEEGTTGISEVRSQMDEVSGELFDLNGRRVAQPTKGIYILNGKKVVIK